jgi:hypothetical protein
LADAVVLPEVVFFVPEPVPLAPLAAGAVDGGLAGVWLRLAVAKQTTSARTAAGSRKRVEMSAGMRGPIRMAAKQQPRLS